MRNDDSQKRPLWSWSQSRAGVELRFIGRAGVSNVDELRGQLVPPPREVVRLRQVHSDRVVAARPGSQQRADALVTKRDGLALAIASADCVPVLMATPEQVAAAHAGWRGLVDGVLGATLARLDGEPTAVEAWIGPSIGVCCYEVGPRVAGRLSRSAKPEFVVSGPGGKPHVDLQAVAAHQLRSRGVRRIRRIELCTRCHPQFLWSYRRDAEAAGRNWALIWRQT